MLRLLVSLHRWLGVAFCLPLAMWFATGIVVHFVPFPSALSEAERSTGRDELDLARVGHGPAEAVAASASRGTRRVRLIERADGPIYLVAGPSGIKAVRAGDLADGAIRSEQSALSIVATYARGRHLDFSRAAVAGLASHDQWTMAGEYDPHRPLYRIALNDESSTDLYVSSSTGEVMLETTRYVRGWNYLGSVSHWLYFTGLRSHAAAWRIFLWWFSFLALVAVTAGALVGPARLKFEGGTLVSPYCGWQAWHHRLGLVCMPFIFTWLFTGWLSLDNGLLFSSGKPSAVEAEALFGEPSWDTLPPTDISPSLPPLLEVNWFAFGGRIYRREREAPDRQRLVAAHSRVDHPSERRGFLQTGEINAAFDRLQRSCEPAFPVALGDGYLRSAIADASVFRVVCGSEWFEIDGAEGRLEKIDASRRSYHWLDHRLHRLDLPFLAKRPTLRTVLIVLLSGAGLTFSFTAAVVAWRRVRAVAAR